MKRIFTLATLLTITYSYAMNTENLHENEEIDEKINELVTYSETLYATVRAQNQEAEREVAALHAMCKRYQRKAEQFTKYNATSHQTIADHED